MSTQARLAVMQPYFFPYLGYFQLIAASDTFVFFDDVNFIKKGWINRNNLLGKDGPQAFTIPLIKASQNRKINETGISEYGKWRDDFLHLIRHTYHKAPYYIAVEKLIKEVLFTAEFTNISSLAKASISGVMNYVDLHRTLKSSSDLEYSGANGQEKILSICELLGIRSYVNPINGRHLYNSTDFSSLGIALSFVEPVCPTYKQFSAAEFVPYLSVIDVLMFNTPEAARTMIENYKLIAPN